MALGYLWLLQGVFWGWVVILTVLLYLYFYLFVVCCLVLVSLEPALVSFCTGCKHTLFFFFFHQLHQTAGFEYPKLCLFVYSYLLMCMCLFCVQ